MKVLRASEIEVEQKPLCPFCGMTDKKLLPAHGSQFHEKKGVQVECINCGARGPIYGDSKSAFTAWKSERPNVMCTPYGASTEL